LPLHFIVPYSDLNPNFNAQGISNCASYLQYFTHHLLRSSLQVRGSLRANTESTKMSKPLNMPSLLLLDVYRLLPTIRSCPRQSPQARLQQHGNHRPPGRTKYGATHRDTININRVRRRITNPASKFCTGQDSCPNGVVLDLILETEHLPGDHRRADANPHERELRPRLATSVHSPVGKTNSVDRPQE
jgi:hypothetical protein